MEEPPEPLKLEIKTLEPLVLEPLVLFFPLLLLGGACGDRRAHHGLGAPSQGNLQRSPSPWGSLCLRGGGGIGSRALRNHEVSLWRHLGSMGLEPGIWHLWRHLRCMDFVRGTWGVLGSSAVISIDAMMPCILKKYTQQ